MPDPEPLPIELTFNVPTQERTLRALHTKYARGSLRPDGYAAALTAIADRYTRFAAILQQRAEDLRTQAQTLLNPPVPTR